jgi:hypothetical protein
MRGPSPQSEHATAISAWAAAKRTKRS